MDSLTKANAAVPDSLKTLLESLKARSPKADSSKAKADSAAAKAKADSAVVKADSLKTKADTAKAKAIPSRKPRSRATSRPRCASRRRCGRDIPKGTVVLRGGRAITMKGKEIIENADIVVTRQPDRGDRRARSA